MANFLAVVLVCTFLESAVTQLITPSIQPEPTTWVYGPRIIFKPNNGHVYRGPLPNFGTDSPTDGTPYPSTVRFDHYQRIVVSTPATTQAPTNPTTTTESTTTTTATTTTTTKPLPAFQSFGSGAAETIDPDKPGPLGDGNSVGSASGSDDSNAAFPFKPPEQNPKIPEFRDPSQVEKGEGKSQQTQDFSNDNQAFSANKVQAPLDQTLPEAIDPSQVEKAAGKAPPNVPRFTEKNQGAGVKVKRDSGYSLRIIRQADPPQAPKVIPTIPKDAKQVKFNKKNQAFRVGGKKKGKGKGKKGGKGGPMGDAFGPPPSAPPDLPMFRDEQTVEHMGDHVFSNPATLPKFTHENIVERYGAIPRSRAIPVNG